MASEHNAFPIVGIGASAGGLAAFRELLRELPADAGMAYVLVQHLDPTHESLLPDLLARVTPMEVHEAQEGMAVQPNHLYVIIPNTDMTIVQDTLQLVPRSSTGGQHLSIDTFLCSLAKARTSRAMGVILSGTAADGTVGLQAIKAEGGMTFAQDPASAGFAGMPQSAITAGYVDFIGSPQAIARELTRISRHPYVRQPDETEAASDHAPVEQEQATGAEPTFQQILRLLGRRTGTDFTAYKPTTLKRRIQRRMALAQITSLDRYLTYLTDHQGEVEALYQDALIGVTGFFRDEATFATLEQEVLPHLIAEKTPRSPLRVWVPGCSTGQEVYSLAICLLEFLAAHALPTSLQLFGTDLNAQAIEYARAGVYPAGALEGLSQAQLERFFHAANGTFHIDKTVRDLCVFAQHDLLKDPPFSRIDLLSCQNVLIYLGLRAQKKVAQSFHYALAKEGVLLLGPSESIGNASPFFAPLGEHKRQWYVKKASGARPLGDHGGRDASKQPPPEEEREEQDRMKAEEGPWNFDLQHETDRLLASFAPASVVVNAEMEILHFRGETYPYLRPGPGRASLNLFKMARAGLDLDLRATISKAKRSGQAVKKAGIQFHDQGTLREIAVEVIPLKASSTERYFVVLFQEEGTASMPLPAETRGEQARRRGSKDQRIGQLERELEATREEMRSTIEELEAANEELHSANEESLSNNEELQSVNEELETSKEEIQSSNEELLIVNAELQQRNAQVQEERAFAEAVVETIREPLLILDAALRVEHANRAFYQHFHVEAADTERRRLFELGAGQWNIPALRALLEDLLPANHALSDYEVTHTFPRLGQRTMLLNARRIEYSQRILLAIEDVTARTQAEEERKQMLVQREAFMAIASHELKTPVSSLKGYTQVLHAHFTQAGDDRSAALLTKMDTQLNKLIKLIGELLDVSKIEAGQFAWHVQSFDLDGLVREIVEEVSRTTQGHQIRIEGVAKRLVVSGDREHLGQVLTNLLTNAVKYSPQAERVLVKVAADGDNAVVGVQDFGIGVAPEKQPHLFERFFRVSDAEHETFPGLGLGLYISAQIIERYGGRLWVESRVGEGSTFAFTVPLSREPEASTRKS
ncbi:MAG TPA: chemotaxis protein CheB [Ktedonobacteraceae bacterium]|nr:chemotaxis protein CheB [Ktedonobacteraceae bacterium]